MFARKTVSEDYLYRGIEATTKRLKRFVSIIEIAEYMGCDPDLVSGPLHSLIEKGLVEHAKDKGLYFRVVQKRFVKIEDESTKKVGRPRRKKSTESETDECEIYNEYGFEIAVDVASS